MAEPTIIEGLILEAMEKILEADKLAFKNLDQKTRLPLREDMAIAYQALSRIKPIS